IGVGSNFNPGLDLLANKITYDDIPIQITGSPASLTVSQITVGIRRTAGSPAEQANLYFAQTSAVSPYLTVPGTLFGTVAVPATVGVNTNYFVTIGDGVTPLFTVPLDYTFYTDSTVGAFALGVQHQIGDTDVRGWLLSTGPDSGADLFWVNGPDSGTCTLSWFGGSPVANFYAQIYGVGVPEPATLALLAAGVLALIRRR
ncbi:MAG TPA: PEP-CTERM sorting domain-containing protein, partial [Phycisphaerae bacterium]|nr:PEP-CTERM sorting domain-containing protein [Phycisphaerae bacterium]